MTVIIVTTGIVAGVMGSVLGIVALPYDFYRLMTANNHKEQLQRVALVALDCFVIIGAALALAGGITGCFPLAVAGTVICGASSLARGILGSNLVRQRHLILF